jgi:spermidine synthase
LLLFFLFLSGILSVLTQNILIREIYTIFNGNELTYGLVVSFWLAGAGLGSFWGRKINEEKLYLPFLILALYFPISIYSLRFLPGIMGYEPGEFFSLSLLLIETSLLLFPIYLNFGLIFALAQKKFSRLSESNLKGITRPYIFESLGDLLGGILFSYIFVSFLSPTRNLFLVSAVCILPVVLLKSKRFMPLFLIFIVFFLFPGFENSIKKTYEKLYKGFQVEDIIETKYGRYMEISKGEQHSLLSNGVLTYTYPDITTSEFIHLPLLLSPGKKEDILYLGLAGPEVIKELSKYDNSTIVHPDAKLQKILQKHIDKEFLKKINFIASDPILFLKKTNKKFDAIYLGIGDPLSISSNRFYSLEFCKLLSEKISNEGVVYFSISSGEDYLNETILDYNSLIFWTYRLEFPYHFLIPGYNLRLVFSKTPLTYEEKRIKDELKKLNLQYLDEYIIISSLPIFRIREVETQLNDNFIGFNTDKKPRAFLLSLLIYLRKHGSAAKFLKPIFNAPIFLIFLFIPLPIIFRKTLFRVSLVGAIAIGIPYCCVLSLQILYGNVYHLVGLISGLFMFGVGIGTFLTEKIKLQEKLKTPFIILTILSFFLYVITQTEFSIFLALVLIPLISFTCGTAVGWTYTAAGTILKIKQGKENVAPSVYAFDLIGGSAGALLFSFFLLPAFGIGPTILLLVGISLLAYLFA